MKIIVVHDDNNIRRAIREALSIFDENDVLGCLNQGKSVLEMIQREQPNLVFLEIKSGEDHDWETFRQIRQSRQLRATAVVVVTPASSNVKTTMQAIWHLSAFDFVTTPCQKDSLREEINRILEKIRIFLPNV